MSTEEDKIKDSIKKRYANVDDEIREYWDKKIDEEFNRRKAKKSVAEDPKDYAKGRHLGKQDIGDISYKMPWQKIVRDQLGVSMPINTPYRCPVCGKQWMLDMPPETCICGAKSFLHLRKLVNLKY
jgi:hypothetical protein